MLNQKNADILIGFFLIFCLLSLIFIAIPMGFPYVFNFDESIELTRVHLLFQNYIFFEEIWNDHPLGLPMIFKLASIFFGITLTSARYVILLFSAANILIFYFILRLECDKIASIISTLILLTSFQYIPLSGLVLNEIPSLSLGMLSLLLMYLYARQQGNFRYIYLLLCAFIFVISLEVKLSSVTVIPALTAIGFFSNKIFSKKIKDAVIWIASASLIFIFLSVTFLPFSYNHLIGIHGEASAKLAITDPSLTLSSLIKTGIQYEPIYALLAILAIFSIVWTERRYRLFPPLLWLGFNLLRFALTSPVWPTYYIYLALPIAWIIGIFLNDLKLMNIFKRFRTRNITSPKFIFQSLLILATFCQFAVNTAKIVTAPNPKRYRHPILAAYNLQAQKYKVHPAEAFFKQYQGRNKAILTDNPYFIHKFELDTPPETAILSRKRVVTEGLDGDFIFDVLRQRKPDFVLLYRFSEQFLESQALSEFLQDNYVEYPFQNAKGRLFIAKNRGLSHP